MQKKTLHDLHCSFAGFASSCLFNQFLSEKEIISFGLLYILFVLLHRFLLEPLFRSSKRADALLFESFKFVVGGVCGSSVSLIYSSETLLKLSLLTMLFSFLFGSLLRGKTLSKEEHSLLVRANESSEAERSA